MNVLLFTLEYPPFNGGVANYYGHIVDNWPTSDKIFVLDNSKKKLCGGWLWPKWLPAIWQLYKIIKCKKVDYVLVGHILPLGTVAWLFSFFKKINYSVFLHGLDLSLAIATPKKFWLTRAIIGRSDKIICSNSFTATTLVNKINSAAAKIFTVNPGCDVPPTIPEEDLISLKNKYNLNERLILFSIGRLIKRKGFDQVIKTWPQITATLPKITYVIAGNGPDENRLHQLAIGQENIIFLGSVTEKIKWQWLKLCDIFIMPAREIDGDYEGFGIVYLEANVCCRPVIAGASGGVGDAVENNISGLLVNPSDAAEIATAIIKLASDKELRMSLGEQGRQRANNFNWILNTKKIFNIINNI